MATGAVAVTTSNSEGLYAFPDLQAGDYELKISIRGFRDYTRRGISLRIGGTARLDVKLQLGVESQSIEVSSNAFPLNFENAELKEGIAPDTLSKLPRLADPCLGGGMGMLAHRETSRLQLESPFEQVPWS